MSQFGGVPVEQPAPKGGSRFGGVPADGGLGGASSEGAPQPLTEVREQEPSWGDTATFLGKRALTAAATLPGVPADLVALAARNLPTGAGTFLPIIGPTITAEQIRMRQPGADSMTPLGTENIRAAIDDLSGGALTPRAPRTTFERYGGAVADFAGAVAPSFGAGAIPATGRALAGAGGASLTGGVGQELARDIAPDNPYAPIVGGVVGSVLNPSVLARAPGQLVRGAIRGGEQGRQAVNKAVAAFKEFGSSPTVGQAAPESGIGRVIESVLARSPGGAHIMLDKFRSQLDKAGKYVNDLTTKIAGTNVTYHDAGQAIATGARQFRGRYDKLRTALEEQFNKMVPRDTVFLAPQYEKALNELTGVAKGFPATQQTIQNPFVRQLAADLKRDAKGGPRPGGLSGTISLEALRGIRTRIGMELDQAMLKPDVDTGSMKKLYGALTRDIEDIANQAGPQARAAWDRAMKVEAEGARRLEHIIDPLIKNRTIEQIQQSVARLDGTRARGIMQSLTAQQRRIVASSIMEDMGRAKPSQQYQNADEVAAAEFSFETFLTNYRAMKQRGMADAVFGIPETAGMRDGLDALLTAAGRARESARFLANPSGSARQGMAQAGMYGLVTAPFGGLSSAVPVAVGAYIVPNTMARLFRSPRFVEWLGKATKTRPEEFPSHVARLAAIVQEDPDLAEPVREYVAALQGQVGAPTASREAR